MKIKIKLIIKKQLGIAFFPCCLIMFSAGVFAATPNVELYGATTSAESLLPTNNKMSPTIKVGSTKPVVSNQIKPKSNASVVQPVVNKKPTTMSAPVNKPAGAGTVNNKNTPSKRKPGTGALTTNKPTVNGSEINKGLPVPLVNQRPVSMPASSPIKFATPKSKNVYKAPVVFGAGMPNAATKSRYNNVPPIKAGGGFVPAGSVNAKSISNVSGSEKPRYTGMDDIIREFFIYKDEFDNAVWEMFSRVRPKLSNYGPRIGNSWYKPNASYIDFDGAFGLSKRVFSIPAFNAIPFSYYVKDIYSGPMQEINGGPMLWDLVNTGSEVKGHCAASGQCNDGDDRSAPDIKVNNISIYVIPNMAVRNGSLSFSSLSVSLNFSFDERRTNAACNAIGNNFNCSLLRSYENTIKNKVELEVKNAFEQSSIKDALASKMRYILDQNNIKEVISAEIQGARIKITYRIKNGQMAIQ